jgi:hypothetical protein
MPVHRVRARVEPGGTGVRARARGACARRTALTGIDTLLPNVATPRRMDETLIRRWAPLVPTPAPFRQTPLTRTCPARTRAEVASMDNRQHRMLQTFERILVYLERHPVRPEPPLLAKMKHALATSIARVRDLDMQQHTARGCSAQCRSHVRSPRTLAG